MLPAEGQGITFVEGDGRCFAIVELPRQHALDAAQHAVRGALERQGLADGASNAIRLQVVAGKLARAT